MNNCNFAFLFPFDFEIHQAHASPDAVVETVKPRIESQASMDEAQNAEHEDAQISSSQATFVPSRESQPPTSAQGAGSIADGGRGEEDRGRVAATIRTNDRTSKVAPLRDSTSFAESVKQFQENLEQEFLQFEAELQMQDPQDVVNGVEDWDLLENEYQKEVGNVIAQEKDIMDAFDARFRVG